MRNPLRSTLRTLRCALALPIVVVEQAAYELAADLLEKGQSKSAGRHARRARTLACVSDWLLRDFSEQEQSRSQVENRSKPPATPEGGDAQVPKKPSGSV